MLGTLIKGTPPILGGSTCTYCILIAWSGAFLADINQSEYCHELLVYRSLGFTKEGGYIVSITRWLPDYQNPQSSSTHVSSLLFLSLW